MKRAESFYTLLSLILTLFSCVAGWLALPQLPALLESWRSNPLFWPFVVVVGGLLLVLLLLLPFIDWGDILVLLRQLSPRHRFETRYLQAVDHYLRHTPALLVISESNENRTDLDLLRAYSPLTLTPDPDDPTPLATPERDDPEGGGLLGRRTGIKPAAASNNTGRAQFTYGLLWLAAQAALLTIALRLLANLLWQPGLGLRLNWGAGLWALLVVLFWLGLALLIQRVALPQLRLRWKQRQTVNAVTGSPGAEIWHYPRLLILGDPGSGKTTLLRHIALVCAGERLKKRHRTRLRTAYGWPTCPLPIYVPLRALRAAAVAGTPSLLTSYGKTLQDVALLGQALASADASAFLERRVAQGGCIILVDAFDELPDAVARQRLGRLVLDLPTGPASNPNRIVVTSRIVGYEGQLRGKGFVHRRLAELDTEQTAAFIRTRYQALAQINVRATPERAQRLISRLPTNPGLRRLGRNPFLLALIVSVHLKSPRELPRQRHALYERALDLLVEEWERWKDEEFDLEPATNEAELEQPQKLCLLYELAWVMYEQHLTATDERSHTVISGQAAEAVLAQTLERMPTITAGRSGEALQAHCHSEARRWLRNLGQRGGVLQELGNIRGSSEVEIQFAHQTFQEYLAAQAITHASAATQQQRISRLRERWNDARWREVLLLYAATCPDAAPLVQHLLQQQQTDADLLAGAVLAEAGAIHEHTPQTTTLERLRQLALADAPASTTVALEALQTLDEIQGTAAQPTLLHAMNHAPHLTVRRRSIELLAKMEPNRPAPAPLDAPVQAAVLRLLCAETRPDLRLTAGFALARGDPRYAANRRPELVAVPAGSFLMGSRDTDPDADADEKPQHHRELALYSIGKTPVTNAEWRRFMDGGGYHTRRYWSRAGWRWRNCGWEPENVYNTLQQIAILVLGSLFDRLVGLLVRRPPFSQPWSKTWDDPDWNGDNQPVVGISYYEAEAYCRWLSETSGHPYRLPTEAEWEKAARGPDGCTWPWGDTWYAGRCNSREAGLERTTPVGSYPAGASPYTAQDMAGNVWEWCQTRYKNNYPGRRADWSDHMINVLALWTNARVIRGGSWYSSQKGVRGAHRVNYYPRSRFNSNGLRLASHSLPEENAES